MDGWPLFSGDATLHAVFFRPSADFASRCRLQVDRRPLSQNVVCTWSRLGLFFFPTARQVPRAQFTKETAAFSTHELSPPPPPPPLAQNPLLSVVDGTLVPSEVALKVAVGSQAML